VMRAAAPVVVLGRSWLAGDCLGALITLVPAQLLARWTIRDERLAARTALQMVTFGGLVVFLIPAIAIAGSGTSWVNPFDRPRWQLSLIAQVLALPAIVGITAVQEVVTRGLGTPLPVDPPRRLVTTGIYAYVRNPMQLSGVLLLLVLGLAVENIWIAAAGLMAHVYAAGLAGWDEEDDLSVRFGGAWTAYRQARRQWLPS